MIIVSQDKKEVINFEKILSVKLFHDDEDNECLYEIYTTVNAPGDNYILLGQYKTEERAKEVLQEITQRYCSYLELTGGPAIVREQMDMQPNIFNIPKMYEMPQN